MAGEDKGTERCKIRPGRYVGARLFQDLIDHVKDFGFYYKRSGKILKGFIQGCGICGWKDMIRLSCAWL